MLDEYRAFGGPVVLVATGRADPATLGLGDNRQRLSLRDQAITGAARVPASAT